MDAKKCDKCNQYYDEYKIYFKKTNGNIVHTNRIKLGDTLNVYDGFDLCPSCMRQILAFLNISET